MTVPGSVLHTNLLGITLITVYKGLPGLNFLIGV